MARKNKEDEDDYQLPAKKTSRKRPKTWAANQTTSLRKALLTNKKKKDEARPVVEDDDHINEQYYDDFRQHVVDLRAHLAGKWTGQEEQEQEPEQDVEAQLMEVDSEDDLVSDSDAEDDRPYDPFTATNWTDLEKDTFFHAVATHSRLRPDLIAASIKTKNMYDVCLYMRYLDDSLAKLKEDELALTPEPNPTETEPEDDGEEGEFETSIKPTGDDDPHKPRAFESDASKKARRDAKLEAAALQRRNAAPPAMEMSVPWTEFEDRLAKLLCNLEDDDQRRGGDVALASAMAQECAASNNSPRKKQKLDKKNIKGKGRAKEDQLEQASGRSQRSASSPRSSTSSPSRNRPSPSSDSHPSTRNPGPSSSSSTAPVWKTANVYFLDGHLQVLETILRDAEDARAAADLAGQSSFIQEKMRQRSRSKSRTAPPNGATSVHGASANKNTAASTSTSTSTFRVVDGVSSTGGQRQSTSAPQDDARHLDDADDDDVDSYILPRRGESETSSAEPHLKSQLKSQRKSESKEVGATDLGEDEEEEEDEEAQGQDVEKEKIDKDREEDEDEKENEEERALKDPNLCPTVRRRFLNRIYMRKRRAMARGGLEEVEKVDTISLRLKPGRKTKRASTGLNSNTRATTIDRETSVKAGKKRKRTVADEEGDESEEVEDDNVDEDRVDWRDKKNRFWGDIEEAEIDDSVLEKEGMAYFNLSMLGKLLKYVLHFFAWSP